MFIINLKYIVSIDKVEDNLQEHKKFLEKYFKTNNFILAGRKNPRDGGIIIANFESLNQAEKITNEDPFIINKVAEYEIIEVLPSIINSNIEMLLKQ